MDRTTVLRVLGLTSLISAGVVSANPIPAGAESLAPLVASLNTSAAVVVRRASDGAEWTGGGQRVDRRFVPASTFKIPNTLIVLGAGIIADPEKDIIPWDGIDRGGAWDQDQTLRTAFRRSAPRASGGFPPVKTANLHRLVVRGSYLETQAVRLAGASNAGRLPNCRCRNLRCS